MRREDNIITPPSSLNRIFIPLPFIKNNHHLLKHGNKRYFLRQITTLLPADEVKKYLSSTHSEKEGGTGLGWCFLLKSCYIFALIDNQFMVSY